MACRLFGAKPLIWTNAGIILIGPLGTSFSENLTEIITFSFKEMYLKVSSAKWRPFCLGLNVLIHAYLNQTISPSCRTYVVSWKRSWPRRSRTSTWPSLSTAITRNVRPAFSPGSMTSRRRWRRWRLGWKPPPLMVVVTYPRLWQTPGMRYSNWTGEKMPRKSASTSQMHLLMGWGWVGMPGPKVSSGTRTCFIFHEIQGPGRGANDKMSTYNGLLSFHFRLP